MWKWPWITALLTAILIVSPPGRDLVQKAFYSGEALSRSISQLLLMIIAGILVALALMEWLIWFLIRRHRRAKLTES